MISARGQHIYFFFAGNLLVREWSKYRYGIFPETGFHGDSLYPHVYNDGNDTIVNNGCKDKDQKPFCPLDGSYNRNSPTKQNLLCREMSALEIISNHDDFDKRSNITRTPAPIKFSYHLKTSSRFVLVLDRTASMDVANRWTYVKRSFFRFFQHLPIGSHVSIVTFGGAATVNLPPTVVTDINREGLHGRIPRKVLKEDVGCVTCGLNVSLKMLRNAKGKLEPGTVILVSGSTKKPLLMSRILEEMEEAPVQVFPVVFPGTGHPDLARLSGNGKRYAVPETEASPLAFLSAVLLDILHESVGIQIQKLHEKVHTEEEFSGTFTLEESMLHKMTVTMSIDDEEKVEFFEVTNPSGKRHLFSKFEDGMVIFKHQGLAQAGIWSYHAKLYPSSGLPSGQKITVDVVSQSNDDMSAPFLLSVSTNVDVVDMVDAYKNPIKIYARLTQGSHSPVLRANVHATIYRPGDERPVILELRDNGSGDPDMTEGDGIYSAYFADFSSVPGFYSVQVTADHDDGYAMTVKREVERDSTSKGKT